MTNGKGTTSDGQSADDAASRKLLVQVERCRRDQSETILKRFGERER